MGRKPTYTSADALADLGSTPNEVEIARLKQHYPTFDFVRRSNLLQRMLDNSSNDELVRGKLIDLGIDPTSITKQAKGGHARWVVAKMRRTVIRFLYLRHRIDEGMSQRQANQQLLKVFKFSDGPDAGQSSIRKATHSPVLDGDL